MRPDLRTDLTALIREYIALGEENNIIFPASLCPSLAWKLRSGDRTLPDVICLLLNYGIETVRNGELHLDVYAAPQTDQGPLLVTIDLTIKKSALIPADEKIPHEAAPLFLAKRLSHMAGGSISSVGRTRASVTYRALLPASLRKEESRLSQRILAFPKPPEPFYRPHDRG